MSEPRPFFESLFDRVTSRWQRAHPVVPDSGTSEVKPKSDDGEDQLPLGFNALGWYEAQAKDTKTRLGIYKAYDEMDEEVPEFASAMDIYADNATRSDADGRVTLVLKSDNPTAQRILNETRDRLKLEDLLWSLARDIVKYGERAIEPIVDEQFNIVRLKPLQTPFIVEKIDEFGRREDPPYVQVDEKGDVVAKFAEWQCVYFANKRSLSDTTGTGIARAAIRVWKQLRMMEDALVIARLTRAHHRLAYLVDTGSLTPTEAQKHLAKVKSHLAKRQTIDPKTGKMDTNYSPLAVEQDVFVATNKESKADVKVLQGDLTVGNLEDIMYFQQKLFTAFKVPKPYLSHEKDTRTKSVVSAQDMQFARGVRRTQQILEEGLRKILDLSLVLRGLNPKTVKYTIGFPVISIVDDLRVWQTRQLQMLVAQMMKQVFWPSDEWIFTKLLGYAQDEVAEILKGQVKPDKFNGLYQAPKVGATANNAKVGAEAALADFEKALESLPEEQRESLTEAISNLRELTNWKLSAAA